MAKGRRLNVNGRMFSVVFGKGNCKIRSDDGKFSRVVSYTTLTGRSLDAIERGQWKKTSDGMVKPGDVVSYLLTETA